MKWYLCLAGLSVVLASGCDVFQKSDPLSPLEKIRQQGVLVVLTHNTSTTYFEAQDGLAGFEYDLASDFAAYLGVNAQF